jgi:integrase
LYIQKVGDKWRVFVEKHGHRPSKLCDSKAEAQRWGTAKELELDALKDSKGKTFGAATVYYLKVVSPNKVNATEWESRRFAAMSEFFKPTTPLTKIDTAKIGQWRDDRLKTVKASTVLREVNLLRNLFTRARDEWKWISHDPFKGVWMPEEGEDREMVWNWRQIRLVLRYLQSGGPKQQQVGWAFHCALRTAMRLKETLAAELSGNVAVLRDTKTMSKGDRGARLVKVPLTRHGRRVMARKPEITVSPNEASTLFSEASKAAGVREKGEDGVTFHDSRATALTHLARKVDVLTLSRISRHRDINILRRKYYRESAEQIAARL